MSMKLRPLNKAGKVVDKLGYSISYMYDDLIFLDNTALLFQYDDNTENGLIFHFNVETDDTFIKSASPVIEKACIESDMKPITGKRFKLENVDGSEEIKIHFI